MAPSTTTQLKVVGILVAWLDVGYVRPEGWTLDRVNSKVREVVRIHLHGHLLWLGQAVDLGQLFGEQ